MVSYESIIERYSLGTIHPCHCVLITSTPNAKANANAPLLLLPVKPSVTGPSNTEEKTSQSTILNTSERTSGYDW